VGCGEQFLQQSFSGEVICARGKIVIPIYVGKAHASGLGWQLLAEFRRLTSGQQRERFEHDAMFGILPVIRAQ